MASIRLAQTPEVLIFVFEFLDPYKLDTSLAQLEAQMQCCRKSLAQSALVSRAFSKPALSILWRRLDDLKPILNFFDLVLFRNTTHEVVSSVSI